MTQPSNIGVRSELNIINYRLRIRGVLQGIPRRYRWDSARGKLDSSGLCFPYSYYRVDGVDSQECLTFCYTSE